MSSRQDMAALGWEVSVDDEAGALEVEHPASGTTYVLEEDGSLRVPGEGELGDDLRALRETMTDALEGDGDDAAIDESPRAAGGGDGPTGPAQTDQRESMCGSAIACTGDGSVLELRPTSRLEIDAPSVTISANVLEVESNGNARIDAAGAISLDGSLIELN